MSSSFECSQLTDSTSIRTQFPIQGTERIIYICIGSLSLAVAVFNITVLMKVRALKEPPSDILIILSIYSITRTVLIDATLIYDDFNPGPAPSTFNDFCIATGFIDMGIRTAKTIYTLILTVLYAHKVKNPLEAWATPKKEVHFLCLFLSLLVALVLYFSGKIGLTLYGYCGAVFSVGNTFALAAQDIIFFVVLVVTSGRFLRNVKRLSANNQVIREFYNYYMCFIVIISINNVMEIIAGFLVASSCAENNWNFLQDSKIAVNTTQSSLSFFVLIVIVLNPQFRRVISLRFVSGMYHRYQKWMEKKRSEPLQQEMRPSFYDQLLSTNRRTILIELTALAALDQGYLSDLKDKSRACLLSSVLGCLSLTFFQARRATVSQESFRSSIVDEDSNDPFAWNFFETCSFTLTSSLVDYYPQIFTKKLPPVAIKFTSYSPRVLLGFASNSASRKQIWQTLAPCNNEQAIAKDCGSSDGGRSGQFFFFTSNKTLILKTISRKEKQVFLQRLQYFHRHFAANPHSLIVKQYSIVSVLNPDSGDEINFCLMGNIIREISKEHVLRCYDLKGSLHSRQVLKGKQVQADERVSSTLKDIDFDRLQGKILLSYADSQRLKAIIRADSNFLCTLGLIDYSLLLIKLDTTQIAPRTLKALPHWRSTKEGEQEVVYVIGIIDYLETWNLRKKGEKWYKSLFVDKKKISSQNPGFYSDRFIAYTSRILTQ